MMDQESAYSRAPGRGWGDLAAGVPRTLADERFVQWVQTQVAVAKTPAPASTTRSMTLLSRAASEVWITLAIFTPCALASYSSGGAAVPGSRPPGRETTKERYRVLPPMVSTCPTSTRAVADPTDATSRAGTVFRPGSAPISLSLEIHPGVIGPTRIAPEAMAGSQADCSHSGKSLRQVRIGGACQGS